MARLARAHRTARHAWALLLYSVGSLFATWPLAAHFTTHVTGDGIDDPALAWNLWWIKARLVDQVQPDIFHVGWLFHPIEINLGYYTLTPLNGLLSIPLQSATSLVIANNVLLLSSFVLGGYGTMLLVQAVWARPLAHIDARLAWAITWLAGAFYAFAGAKLFYASLGQFNIASSHWIPFCALYVWRTLHTPTARNAWRNGALAGFFLVLQAWAELTYASFLLLFFALAYLYFSLIWLLPTPRQITRWWHGTQGMAAAAFIFVVGIAPFLAAILPDMRVEGDFFASGGGFAGSYSADLLGYLVPTRLHPWLGEWVVQLPFANDKAQHIFLGYTLMALIAVGIATGLAQRRQHTTIFFWLFMLVSFWLLTLGPFVRWAGTESSIPGPFALVSQLPFFNGNRYPSRYVVMLLLAAAVLATPALLWLASRGGTRARTGRAATVMVAITLLFAVEHLSIPLPLNDFRIPAIYAQLAAQPGDFAILELPTGWRNGARVLGKSDVLIMMQQWYQSAHGKRRLGGNTSRNPVYKFQYYSETPVLADLIALMNADREHLGPTLTANFDALAAEIRYAAPDLFRLLDIRYVTVHVEKSPDLLLRVVEEALPVTLVDEWRGPDWTGAASTIRLYAVDDLLTTQPLDIDLADDDAHLYLAEGWSPVGMAGEGMAGEGMVGRLATRPRAELMLPRLDAGAGVTLTFAQPTRVAYAYQGKMLTIMSGMTHTLTLPATRDPAPTSRLTLSFEDEPLTLATLIPTPTPIGATGVSLAPGVALLAQSAGEETGDFAHIWVNGVNWATDGRGYHLVALTPTGQVLANASFDTMMQGESARMAAWLAQWANGTVIAGAVADTAEHLSGDVLGQDAVDALINLGVAGDLRGKFRWSHAFVGVAGAVPESAAEAVQLIAPATVWVGAALPTDAGYGPLQRVQIVPHTQTTPTDLRQ